MSEAGPPSTKRETRLELIGIRKAYPAVVANDGIDLRVGAGEIHAVVGENGAGKSTLMKIVYGMVAPDAGSMLWNGREIEVRSPAEAQRLGIGMVFQHFALFDTLTVAENVALATPGKPSIGAVSRRIAEVSAHYGLPVDPARPVHSMSVGERQRVEILRALLQSPRLLIMDEPTSVLTPQAVVTLFATLRRLADEGCSILYISHKLDEIRDLCERATILRAGRVTGVVDPRERSVGELARLMIGTDPPAFRRVQPATRRDAGLVLRGLSAKATDPFGTDLRDIDLTVRSGEIVGIAGVSGNGQQELLACLSGERPLRDRDMVTISGVPAGALAPRARRRLGLAFVPEDRLGRGAVPDLSLAENGLLTADREGLVRHGFLSPRRMRAFAERCITSFGVRAGGPGATAGSLSGGNLQKFIVGREMLQDPAVLIVAQPTWGVDVGAAVAIRQALLDLRARGAAILVVSEELDEIFEIADRIAVLAGGRLSAATPTAVIDRDAVGLAMSGSPSRDDPPGNTVQHREATHAAQA